MNLAEIVRVESARQAALDRIDGLERDATRILDELEFLGKEVAAIDQYSEKSYASSEIRRLRERVKARKDSDVILRIGGRLYRIDRDIIKAMPFGDLLLANIKLADAIQRWLSPRSKR